MVHGLTGSFVSGIGGGTATSTRTIAEFNVSDFNGAFASIEISDRFSADVNYIEAAVDFDGDNTYLMSIILTKNLSYSATQTGILGNYDANAGIVSLTATNSGISSTSL